VRASRPTRGLLGSREMPGAECSRVPAQLRRHVFARERPTTWRSPRPRRGPDGELTWAAAARAGARCAARPGALGVEKATGVRAYIERARDASPSSRRQHRRDLVERGAGVRREQRDRRFSQIEPKVLFTVEATATGPGVRRLDVVAGLQRKCPRSEAPSCCRTSTPGSADERGDLEGLRDRDDLDAARVRPRADLRAGPV